MSYLKDNITTNYFKQLNTMYIKVNYYFMAFINFLILLLMNNFFIGFTNYLLMKMSSVLAFGVQ